MANIATNTSEIVAAIQQLGWSLSSVDFTGGQYVAKATNDSTGQDIERNGTSPELAITAVYQFAQRANSIRAYASLKKYAAWDHTHWLPHVEQIGEAYSKMPPYDEKAAPAWQALAAESKIQADAIRKQIKVDVVDDPEPYKNAQEMMDDIHKNRHFFVSRANSDHPLWSVEDNINFRIVHDVLGHAQSGGDFGWQGENKACSTHFPLLSPLAREALMTECIGQQAYYRQYHGFGPQKVGLMSEFLHPVQQKEGEHVFVPHGGLPNLVDDPSQMGMGANEAGGGTWVDPSGQGYQSPPFGMPNAVMQGYDVPSGSAVKFNPKGSMTEEPGQYKAEHTAKTKEDQKDFDIVHEWTIAEDDGWSN